MYHDKVSMIILFASTYGGKDGIPKPAEFLNSMSEMANKSLNNESISQGELKSLVTASLGSGWIKLPPESAGIPANFTFQQMKPSLPLETLDNQMKVGFAWEATI